MSLIETLINTSAHEMQEYEFQATYLYVPRRRHRALYGIYMKHFDTCTNSNMLYRATIEKYRCNVTIIAMNAALSAEKKSNSRK